MRRVLVIIGAAGLVLAGCGQPGNPATAGATGGQTVSVDLRDAARTVRLDRGDRLEVSLGSASSERRWRLALYPKKILSLVTPKDTEDAFVFETEQTGRGRVIALVFSRVADLCSGGRLGAKPSLQCPVLGPASGDTVAPRPGVFGITVIVQ